MTFATHVHHGERGVRRPAARARRAPTSCRSSSTARRSNGSTPRRTAPRLPRGRRAAADLHGRPDPTYELDVTVRRGRLPPSARTSTSASICTAAATRGGAPSARRRAGIAARVTFHGRIPIEDVPAVAAADIGLAPTRLDRFTAMTLSTKVYEYAAMGKPVVASRLPLVERTFPRARSRPTSRAMPKAWLARSSALADDPLVREAAIARSRTWSAMRPGSARPSATWRSSTTRAPQRERQRPRRGRNRAGRAFSALRRAEFSSWTRTTSAGSPSITMLPRSSRTPGCSTPSPSSCRG